MPSTEKQIMEENEHIYTHIKTSLDAYTVTPRVTSFDSILKKIEKKKKRRLLFFLLPGAAVLILLSSYFIVNFFSNSPAGMANAPSKKTVLLHKAPETAHKKQQVRTQSASSVEGDSDATPKSITAKKTPYQAQKKSHVLTQAKVPEQTVPAPPHSGQAALMGSKLKTISQQANPIHVSYIAQRSDSLLNAKPEDTLEPDFLVSRQLLLPVNTASFLLKAAILYPPDKFSLIKDSTKKEKNYYFLLGADFNPQAGSFHFFKNDQRNPDFDNNPGEPYSSIYLRERKKNNKIRYNHSFGIKLGMVWKDRYEFMLGYGFQKFNDAENITRVPLYQSLNFTTPSSTTSSPVKYDIENTYRYSYYSLECAQYLKKNYFFTRIKLGAGIQVNHLLKSSVIHVEFPNTYTSDAVDPVKRFNYSLNLKAGVIQNLNQRIQFQLCPNVFYSLNSMFAKDYILKQRNFGLGLQALLLFKIG